MTIKIHHSLRFVILTGCMFSNMHSMVFEQDIKPEAIRQVLDRGSIDVSQKEAANRSVSATKAYTIDVAKINSSSDRPELHFEEITEQLTGIEQQLTALNAQVKLCKKYLNDVRATTIEQIHADQQEKCRLNEQLGRTQKALEELQQEHKQTVAKLEATDNTVTTSVTASEAMRDIEPLLGDKVDDDDAASD